MKRLLLSTMALNAMLLAPLWWRFGELFPRLLAWEALSVAGLCMLLPHRGGGRWLRLALLVWVMLTVLIGLGEAATQQVFGRSLNLYLDVPLLRSVYHLLEGNLGSFAATLVMVIGAGLIGAAAWTLWRGLSPTPPYSLSARSGQLALVFVALGGLMSVLELAGQRPLAVGRTPLLDTTGFQIEQVMTTHHARQAFGQRLAKTPIMAQPLPGLEQRDVLLVFIESYGVTAIQDPRYRDAVLPTLHEMRERLEAAGLHLVSGVLEAPVRGGQSWLSHATTLSGLWIDNQLWYRLMLESGQSTLVDDFRATGQRTLSVMPAITMAWPEGEAYGFDEIHAASDIDYAGPPLNWVTMPDQFTLDYFQRHLREPGPVFAQIALISSHAPWTPILPVLDDWEMIGDGAVFAPWENAGDPPEVLWQEIERIRDHYAWSVDYSLKAAARWAERAANQDSLIILIGDHQAAPLITGENSTNDVPVHIISGDTALLAPFLAHGFVPGSVPEATDDAPGMHRLRHWLQEAFGKQAQPAISAGAAP
ncbi:alkaline phosphatase [Halomonas sediminis]